MKKTFYLKIVSAAAAVFLLSAGVGGTLAYLKTQTNHKANDFTMGDISIKLEEPEWSKLPDHDSDGIPDDADPLVAGKTITKDPLVTNTGKNSAYAYLQVSIPRRSVYLIDKVSGRKKPDRQEVNLFQYQVNTADWYELTDGIRTDTIEGELYEIHVYGYTGAILMPGASTPALFDAVTYEDVLEGELNAGTVLDLRVQAMGIQSQWLPDAGGSMEAQLAEAYKLYLNETAGR